MLVSAVSQLQGEGIPNEIQSFVRRLRCWILLLKNAANMVRFHTLVEAVILEVTDKDGVVKKPVELPWDREGDASRKRLYDLYRSEMDVTAEMMDLLEESGKDCPIITASEPGEEDVFTLSPNLMNQLQSKLLIMSRHWSDLDSILRRPNR